MPETRLGGDSKSAEIIREMTPSDLDNAMKLVRHIVATPEARGQVTLEEGGFLLERLEELVEPIKTESIEYHRRLDKERISRRELGRRARKWGIGIVIAAATATGIYKLIDETIGPAAYTRQTAEDLVYRRALETNNPLGLTRSTKSFSGWTVRYASPDLRFTPTNIASDPLLDNTTINLPGNQLTKLENTGVIIREHIRTTDNKPVGKLAIITKYFPGDFETKTVIEVGEEWVLNDEPAIIIFENQTSGYSHYLSLARSRALNPNQKSAFQLQAVKLQN